MANQGRPAAAAASNEQLLRDLILDLRQDLRFEASRPTYDKAYADRLRAEIEDLKTYGTGSDTFKMYYPKAVGRCANG